LPEFRYTVINAAGQTLNGTIEAENEDVCRRIITQRGLYCLEISAASLASRSLNFGGKTKFKTKELSVFCRQFSTMLNSGIGVIKCLDILYTQSEKPAFKAVIKNVYESVQRGQALSQSLKAQNGAFPDILINMVEAGEVSGTLDRVMERVADHFEKDIKTGNKIKSAMIYPIILGSLTVLVVTVLMVFVLPTFINMFKSSGAELPIPTKILMAISGSMTGYWYIYLIVIATSILVSMNFLKNENGRLKWDQTKTRMPILGKMIVIILSARFSRTLSTLMQSGIPLLKSLEIAGKVLGNKFFEKNVTEMREEIRRGNSLSKAVSKSNIFPIMLLSMITIGEEAGTLEEVLHKTATFYDEESDSAISRMVGMLEPLMIIIMAVIVGFIVVSIIMPIFGMMQNVH
jgi:type IV pilus assembly protein PilC